MLEHKTRLNLYVLLAFFLILTACDMFGGNDGDDDDPPPPTTDSVTVSAEAVTEDGSRIDSAAIAFDGTEAGTGYAEKTYETDAGRSVSVSASEDDYVNTETSIDLGADQNTSLEMLKKLPETITVPVENVAADGDTLITETVTWEDSVVAEDVRSAEVTIPASRTAGELCTQESDLFAEGCISVTPTSDFPEVQEISVQRKMVELTVAFDLPYGESGETDVTVYEPFRADSTKFTGENTVELAKRKQGLEREIDADLVTEEPERSDHVDRLVADTTVSAHENSDPTLSLGKLPACNDGISNDPADDELVDVWSDENGNDFIDESEGDPGCVSSDDDNEGHIVWTGSWGSGGEGNDRNEFVSSAEGERVNEWAYGDPTLNMPESIRNAVLINSRVEVKIEDDQDGEEFAVELTCGSNQNLTDITEDSNEADGWTFGHLRGITAAWFADKLSCSRKYLHASKVRNEEPGDGDDDIFFLVDGDDTIRSFQIRWTIEEEDNHKSSDTAGLAKQNGSNCEHTQNGKMCQSSGLPKLW